MHEISAEGISVGIGDGLLYKYEYNINFYSNIYADIMICTENICDNIQKKLDFYKDKKQDEIDYVKEHMKLLSAQFNMLSDDVFLNLIKTHLNEKNLLAQFVLKNACEDYCTALINSNDTFTHENHKKICEVYNQIIKNLAQLKLLKCCEQSQSRIVLAINADIDINVLTQIESKICAIIFNDECYKKLHFIYVNSQSIPCAVMHNGFNDLLLNTRTMLDGETGVIVQNPDTQTKTNYARKHLFLKRKEGGVQILKGVPASTINGINVKMFASISQISGARKAIMQDAQGIGVFYPDIIMAMQEEDIFDEDILYHLYRDVFVLMGQKRVNVLLKPCEVSGNYKTTSYETSFKESKYKANLRALLRACSFGNVGVLLSHVPNENTINEFKTELKTQKLQLINEKKNIGNNNLEVGAVINTVYCSFVADLIAKSADFIFVDITELTENLNNLHTQAFNEKNTKKSDNRVALRCFAQLMKLLNNNTTKRIYVSGINTIDAIFIDFYLALNIKELSLLPRDISIMKKSIRAISSEDSTKILQKYL